MNFLSKYQEEFEQYLSSKFKVSDPLNLYLPIQYILSNQGKRIRPVLTLLSCELFQDDITVAYPAAMAVEVFHNFTLVHDDIMDEADLRRGKPSIHVKYNTNAAILSGDAMMLLAYKYLQEIEDPQKRLVIIQLLTDTGIRLCEGQQLDVDFETRDDVRIEDYLEMIEKKTSVLLGAALQMGAALGGADEKDQEHIYSFGKYIGLAFQIHDDILDIYGAGDKVGKISAGDIINNKKTYLYLKALELADDDQNSQLRELYRSTPAVPTNKIAQVKSIFDDLVVKEYARQLKDAYLHLGKSHLDAVQVDADKKVKLFQVADYLISRES